MGVAAKQLIQQKGQRTRSYMISQCLLQINTLGFSFIRRLVYDAPNAYFVPRILTIQEKIISVNRQISAATSYNEGI